MKADELKFKVTNKNGYSAIISLDDIMGYEGEECGVFIKSDLKIHGSLRGVAINYNSGYGDNGINEELDFEYIH